MLPQAVRYNLGIWEDLSGLPRHHSLQTDVLLFAPPRSCFYKLSQRKPSCLRVFFVSSERWEKKSVNLWEVCEVVSGCSFQSSLHLSIIFLINQLICLVYNILTCVVLSTTLKTFSSLSQRSEEAGTCSRLTIRTRIRPIIQVAERLLLHLL